MVCVCAVDLRSRCKHGFSGFYLVKLATVSSCAMFVSLAVEVRMLFSYVVLVHTNLTKLEHIEQNHVTTVCNDGDDGW